MHDSCNSVIENLFMSSDDMGTEKFLKIIEHVSHLITYCRISLLMYSGSSSLSNAGHFL